ncbi:MAG TPA: nitroreductase family protein, partial [Clostridiaceae bacterium]|nr:nitroreductase family protein [Clostridiaceae bacterium]
EAASLAPSGTNLQPSRFIVIRSAEARTKLRECTPLPFVAAAPVIIACLIDTQAPGAMGVRLQELREAQAFAGTPLDAEDSDSVKNRKKRNDADPAALKAYLKLNAAIAIDHLTLRAVDLGLGSCWIMMFDQEKTRALLELEDRYEIVALIPVGYPDQSPSRRPRIGVEEILLKEI